MTQPHPGQPQPPETAKDEDAIAFAQGLFQLARNGGTTMLRPLLAAGVPVDIRTSDGDSLLMLASINGHSETVRLLLEQGASPDLCNQHRRTALMQAAMANHAEVVRQLLQAGANPQALDADGKSALELAQAAAAQDSISLLER